MSRRPRSVQLAVLVLLLFALIAPSPAGAAFPGRNGRLAFEYYQLVEDLGNPEGYEELGGIYTSTLKGKKRRELTSYVSDGRPTWSSDGLRIAFRRCDGPCAIWVMNADGSGQEQVTSGDALDDDYPTWSPSGDEIAFQRCVDGCDIWKVSVDDGTETQLTSNQKDELAPSWAPGGRRIAFARFISQRESRIFVVSLPDLEEKRVTGGVPGRSINDFGPDWHPNSKRIVFRRSTSRSNRFLGQDLYSVRATGRHLTRLTDTFRSEESPVYSPDGEHILYSYQYSDGGCNYGLMNSRAGRVIGLSHELTPTRSNVLSHEDPCYSNHEFQPRPR